MKYQTILFLLSFSISISSFANTDPNLPMIIIEDDGAEEQYYAFDDTPNKKLHLEYPDWFKKSLLDLPEDFIEATQKNKGLIIYFGGKNCPYCEKLLNIIFKRKDIYTYLTKYFDIVGIDTSGDIEIITIEGETLSEKKYAESKETHFTPSLLFYVPNEIGQPHEALRLRGYYEPYVFRAAIDFVIGKYFYKQSFGDYFNRVKAPEKDGTQLTSHPLFQTEPLQLDRRHSNEKDKPLMVIFSQNQCHACEILHQEALQDKKILTRLNNFNIAQVNIWSDTPLVTPNGQKQTSREWAKSLDIFYTPSLVFFNQQGKEIFRADSIIRLYRLTGILQYIDEAIYKHNNSFVQWYSRSRSHFKSNN
jgi:thioredoxin-related protein